MKKYSIISYEASPNLGDYIQTFAAKQFFNKNVTLVDREKLHEKPKEIQHLLINGWFMENPNHWPPHQDYQPLFLSFHLNPTAKSKMLNKKGVAYLKKQQPIGCRDQYTLRMLQKKGIQAYFSGCLTLTLQPQINLGLPQSSRNGILVLSTFERLEQMGKALGESTGGILQKGKAFWNLLRHRRATRRLQLFLNRSEQTVSHRSQLLNDSTISETERWKAAQEQLGAIAQAQLVITSRIHSALPAVALGTPVLFLKDGLEHPNQSSRLEGLSQFFTTCHSRELKYLSWRKIKNPEKHQHFVLQMEKQIERWKNTTD